MAWAKVDDQWFASRKVVPLSLAARGLWTTILSWTCAQQSPHVPGHMVAFLASGQDVALEVDELEAAGLWHSRRHGCARCPEPEPSGWVLHDWAEYQDKSVSEKRAEAGAKGGKKSGETRRGSNGKQPDEANGKQTKQTNEANDEAGTHPGPSRPGPAQPGLEDRGDADAPTQLPTPDDGFEQFWDAYPRKDDMKGGGASKKKARTSWNHLTRKQRDEALIGVDHYADYVAQPGAPIVAMATTWLNQERWEQFQEPRRVEPPGQSRASPGSRGSEYADRYRQAAAAIERRGT